MFFSSIKEAGRILHLDPKTITKMLNGNTIQNGPHKGWTVVKATEEDYKNKDNFLAPFYITEREANQYFLNMREVLSKFGIDILNQDNSIKSFAQIFKEVSLIWKREKEEK